MRTTNDEWAKAGAEMLDAFQRFVPYPGAAPDHRADPQEAGRLLGDLLCALMHYSGRVGTSFDAALQDGRSAYAQERRIEPYAVNSLVAAGGRRGVITSSARIEAGHHPDPDRPDLPDPRYEYEVRLVGSREPIRLHSGQLAPAPEFPPLVLGDRTVTTLAEAEEQYARFEARVIVDSRLGSVPKEDDLDQLAGLADGLATWGGTTARAISHSLSAAVEDNIKRLVAKSPAARLARLDLPPGAHPDLSSTGTTAVPADPPAGEPTRHHDRRDGPRPKP